MRINNFELRITLQTLLLLGIVSVAAYCSLQGLYLPAALCLLPTAYLIIQMIQLQKRAYTEVQRFAESIHYRDFSRHFDVKGAPTDLQTLHEGFNEINATFKTIAKEKETQYLYLQKILELVDTGILLYQDKTGEIVWINETLKRLIQAPYLKTIHSLDKRNTDLYNIIIALEPGENKIATTHLEKLSIKLLLSATAFQTEGKRFKLIAFQNVNEALDETESKAWQKLLNVMTHEIMNSIAPISSLAETMKKRLHASTAEAQEYPVEDLALGIDTIKKRSEGLLRFAETYRNLNKITTLNLHKVFVSELLGNIHQLMQPMCEQKGIEMEIILREPGLQLNADINLLEQVLINLVVNAIDAVKDREQPRVVLSAEQNSNKKILIKVADNGQGIPDEVLDKIFIPFFSTKKSGSGIGLSLCKQILMLHKGSLQVQSAEGKGSVFIMQFA